MTTPYPTFPTFLGAPAPRPSHPQATRSMVLGIVGLAGFVVLLVPLALSPLAWYFGANAKRDIDRDPTRWRGRGEAKAGMVLGMIGTALLAIVLVVLALVTGGIAFVAGFDSGYGG